jgi:hypothetical protein
VFILAMIWPRTAAILPQWCRPDTLTGWRFAPEYGILGNLPTNISYNRVRTATGDPCWRRKIRTLRCARRGGWTRFFGW